MQETLERPLVIETDAARYGDALAPLKILRGARLVSLFRRRAANRNAMRRIEDEEVSWIVEALNSPFETNFSFDFNGNDILTSDGHALRQLLENGLENALEICKAHPYYMDFVMDRSQAEYENHLVQLQMARGEVPNTMVEFSAMQEFENDEQEQLLRDLGSFKVDRRMGIIRTSAWDPITRQMTIHSHSVDNSNTTLFRQVIAERFGIEYPEDYLYAEMLLRKPILLDLSADKQALLPAELVAHCDDILTRTTGMDHLAGRTESARPDTFNFVRLQRDVVRSLMKTVRSIDRRKKLSEVEQKALLNAARLGAVALIDSRLGGKSHYGSIAKQTSAATAWATTEQKVYDGCGLVITSDTERDTLLTYSLLAMNTDPTKCVTCPHCDKIVDLPKEEYKKGILHCLECDKAYDKNRKKTINNYSKQKPAKKPKDKTNGLKKLLVESKEKKR